MAHDVFISYSTHDKPTADAICAAMEAAGIRCWIAPRDVLAGPAYSGQITEALRASRLVVVVFSRNANDSKMVVREVEIAVDAGCIIIPFRIEKIEPTDDMEFFLRLPHWLDALTLPLEKHIQGLVRTAILNLADIITPPSASPQPHSYDVYSYRPPAPALLGLPLPTTGLSRVSPPPRVVTERKRLVLLYKRGVQPDEYVLRLLEQRLGAIGHQVFIDRHLKIGVEWAQEIERQIRGADAIVVLLSAASMASEMLTYEVQIAHEARQKEQNGSKALLPRLLPVRVGYDGPLPEPLAAVLNPLEYALWSSPADDDALIGALSDSLASAEESLSIPPDDPPQQPSPGGIKDDEPVGGAVPVGSPFYLTRNTDADFHAALDRRDSIVLVKGPRQMGKTSLMVRGMERVRQAKTAQVVLTDFQRLNESDLTSPKAFYLGLARLLKRKLRLKEWLDDSWHDRNGDNGNFENYLIDVVLPEVGGPLIWCMDEVDRLFATNFESQVFGLFRAWYNERRFEPTGPWADLTIVIGYATEAHLFIKDHNQSPFNVGTRLELADFTPEQVADMNRRYGSPLRSDVECAAFYQLVGGHPYLVRRCLYALQKDKISLSDFDAIADREDSPVGDHLRRIVILLARNLENCAALRDVLQGKPCPTDETFFHLRSAGVIVGDSRNNAKLRNQLYVRYLTRHLT